MRIGARSGLGGARRMSSLGIVASARDSRIIGDSSNVTRHLRIST